jgi:hypothetical protein
MSVNKQKLSVYVQSVGLAAPGMNSWTQGQAVLRGEQPYVSEELPRYAPTLLPPNERRRATSVGRLAFQSAEEAIGSCDADAEKLAAVFTSSGGDTDIVNLICASLAKPERPVSPTHFHNSVHNAAAGYWSIATGSRLPSTSLSAFDGSFSAGLMEAAVLCRSELQPVLLVAYDTVPTDPLFPKRPLTAPFSVALLLTPEPTANCLAGLALDYADGLPESTLGDGAMETLRLGNPAARALPLLERLAKGEEASLVLPAVEGIQVSVEISSPLKAVA